MLWNKVADFSGKSNTKTIVDYCKANNKSCPAAEYAYNYRTVGTETGDWYLPAMGELLYIYVNKVKLNATLQALGKIQFDSGTTYSRSYWSSSEADSYDAWLLDFHSGALRDDYKDDSYFVRPVIAY